MTTYVLLRHKSISLCWPKSREYPWNSLISPVLYFLHQHSSINSLKMQAREMRTMKWGLLKQDPLLSVTNSWEAGKRDFRKWFSTISSTSYTFYLVPSLQPFTLSIFTCNTFLYFLCLILCCALIKLWDVHIKTGTQEILTHSSNPSDCKGSRQLSF